MGKSRNLDMTEGSIWKLMLQFTLPLLIGNIFQLLYNTVDSLVLGNFVGTEALAAISATTMVVGIVVFFFNGMSTGATVLIGQIFGARESDKMHAAVETTMTLTFIIGIIFTVLGIPMVPFMLELMSTPENVMEPASAYLEIYFAGIMGLLIYNMGSGILRAVGDSVRPLLFLIFTSILNTVLDLLFVIAFHMGIEGVAYATIISQFVSAFLILVLLCRTKDIYRFSFRDMTIEKTCFSRIMRYGLPAAIQSTITSISNVVVQGYVNHFGSSCMAGWGCYNKIDQFIFLPVQSLAMAATSFVSQNIGAGKIDRANQGTKTSLVMIEGICIVLASLIFIFAPEAIAIFTSDDSVIAYGTLFLRLNVFFLCFNAINHTLAGALRGRGDSAAPMFIMIFSFVILRQIYLYAGTRLIGYNEIVVGLGYPVGWVSCCIIELIYFFWKYTGKRAERKRHYPEV